MAKQAETNFKERVLRDLATLPGIWFFKTQMRATRGIPDVIICLHGHFVALELKRSAKEGPTKLQEHILKQISAAHGLSMLAHPTNWDNIFSTLKHMQET